MERTGTCSSCGARFRVPDSVAGNRAKCSKCGGVVEIAAAPSAATPRPPPPPAAARPAVPAASGHARHTAEIRRARLERQAHHVGPKKGNPLLLWCSLGGLAVAAVAGVLLLQGGGAGPGPAPAPVAPVESRPAEPVASAPAPAEPVAAAPKPPPATKPARPPRKRVVEDVDLAQVSDVPEDPGTSAELAAEIAKSVALVLDPDAGAKGIRAQNRLIEIGKPAFPALLNALKRLDYATEEGMRTGSVLNHAVLERMTGGHNFEYRPELAEEAIKWNRRVAKEWIDTYLKARDDAAAWAAFTKQPAPGKEGEEKKKAEDDLGLDKVGPG